LPGSNQTSGFSLYDYPVLTCWPGDGGPFITLPMVFSRNPETGKRNCGMYRMQVFDERTTGMHWQTHKQGAEHYRRMAPKGRQTRMEVAWPSVPIPPPCTPPFCRCRPISTK
jgi:4-hydroxy-3-polyprenylbenzoate decarboxylase